MMPILLATLVLTNGKTAALFEPFADDASNRGLTMQSMTDGRMKAAVAGAGAHGLQIAIHAIGDRANDEVLKI